ncbi:MAG TPA: hypothetical protein VGI39_15015, partial [Polyangiaceae bacterium]
TIATVSPTFVPISTIDTQITITGTNFIASTSAAIGAQGISTNVVSGTTLQATIPAAYLATAGMLSIDVYNPPPGGGFSPSSVSVTVGTPNPAPTLTSLTPSSIVSGSAAFSLTATGSNFVTGGTLVLGATVLSTTVVSLTEAQATVPAALVAQAGSVSVTFVNPAPGGGASGAVSFAIVAGADAGGDASGPADSGQTEGGETDGGIEGGIPGSTICARAFGATSAPSSYASTSGNTVTASGTSSVIAGFYGGSVDFGGGNRTALSSDFFAAAYDPTCSYLWDLTSGPLVLDEAAASTSDSAGNTYMVALGNSGDNLGSITVGGPGTLRGVLAKIGSTGQPLWAHTYGANSATQIEGIGIDASGNIFIAGTFVGALDLGDGVPLNATTQSAFLAKLDPTGAPVWHHAYPYPALGFSVSASGQVAYAVATTQPGQPGSTTVSVATLDAAGNTIGTWATTLPGTPGYAFDATGALYVYTSGTTAALTKRDSNGNVVWTKSFNPSNLPACISNPTGCSEFGLWSVSTDASGNLYATGSLLGTIDLGTGPLTGGIASPGGNQGYGTSWIAKFDPNGNALWARVFGQDSYGVTFDAIQSGGDGILRLAGSFVGTVDFGLGPVTATSYGDGVLLLLRE